MRSSILAAVLSLSLSLGAQDLYVDADAAPGGDGSGWSTAFDSLQDALAAAGQGTEIWVAQGTYPGGFQIPDGVRLYGGFRSGDTRRSQRDPLGQKTVLDGGGTQRVLDLGDQCLVDGFEVRNGLGAAPGGGGALADGTSPTVQRCVFIGNGNSAGRGSAILVRAGGQPVFRDCVVVDNVGPGHVVDIDGAAGIYNRLTVFRNVGNGLHVRDGATAVITGSIFARNTGRGICDVLSGAVNDPIVENNLFWQNDRSLYHYQGVEYHDAASINALPYASGNISADPMFVDEMTTDLRPRAGSPAVDSGAGPFSGLGLGGNLRAVDGDQDGIATPDMGALEYTALELDVGGTIEPGGTLQVDFGGEPGLPALLAVGEYHAGGTRLPPYGSVHLDLGQPIVIGVVATVPSTLEIPIPPGIPPGTTFGLQAVSATAPTGFLSRPYDLLVR